MAESIESRITEVLRPHEWCRTGNLDVPGMTDATAYKCLCGWSGDDPRSHVASVLAALLRAEWTWSWANGSGQGVPGFGYTVDTREEAVAECDVPYTIVRRWVTPWEPA